MTGKNIGPHKTVIHSCFECKYCHSDYYCIEDGNDCDSGHTLTCRHPDTLNRYIGDSNWTTPNWCTYLTKIRQLEIKN